jgi:hypothetical protein
MVIDRHRPSLRTPSGVQCQISFCIEFQKPDHRFMPPPERITPPGGERTCSGAGSINISLLWSETGTSS